MTKKEKLRWRRFYGTELSVGGFNDLKPVLSVLMIYKIIKYVFLPVEVLVLILLKVGLIYVLAAVILTVVISIFGCNQYLRYKNKQIKKRMDKEKIEKERSDSVFLESCELYPDNDEEWERYVYENMPKDFKLGNG